MKNCRIQDHIESKMDIPTLNKIKRHIDYMIDVERINSLHIEWFGGEPFLYYDEIISPLSKYAKEKCNNANIPFINSSTTNGYYLSPNIISNLKYLSFKSFQITIDGNKQFHDKVKFTKNCDSTFSHVLSNINHILSESDDIIIYLRINYTHKTLTKDIIEEVNDFIEPHNRKKNNNNTSKGMARKS